MLTHEENVLVTKTGPGTPMGEVMRRYWIPALCLGNCPNRIARRSSATAGRGAGGLSRQQGSIGLLDEFCPHRRVSLWLGRNEESGLRCVYHGWKFDVAGTCVDNARARELQLRPKIRTKAYPTVEAGGVIWAYMGPADKMPPPPHFRVDASAREQRRVSKVWEECNWLQALEGGIDTSHAPILHRAISTTATRPGFLSRVHLSGAGHRRWKSMSPTMATAMLGFARWRTARPMYARTISSCPLRKSAATVPPAGRAGASEDRGALLGAYG